MMLWNQTTERRLDTAKYNDTLTAIDWRPKNLIQIRIQYPMHAILCFHDIQNTIAPLICTIRHLV
jgi:hypothetical protein